MVAAHNIKVRAKLLAPLLGDGMDLHMAVRGHANHFSGGHDLAPLEQMLGGE
jgi:hypothetical protein